MKYTFDTLRNRWVIAIITLLNVFIPAFLWAYLRDPQYQNFFPEELYRNNILPVLLFILPPIYFISNRKKFFWKKTAIEINDQAKQLKIDGTTYLLQEIKHYEFRRGSLFNSGTRESLHLKFADKTISVIPCWSSAAIKNYDAFYQHFLVQMEEVHPGNKERIVSPAYKITFAIILVVGIFSFFYLYKNMGREAAYDVLPGLLLAVAIFIPFFFKKARTSR
ncbi:hypothetical protein SAMN04488034_101239 [Salinimicrobium catena]|uniref:Uncharacterized protein n=1 Tax=Salinimicrobium catena TaxID=390640 RepID=A0A1H5HTI4_9FLAO|nr:hypothetical protein [Salinimicrobium catena]SDK72480.1 hypothetical protein SAMN04488140_101239 [Salinimicrobium catena]SEE31124.1 hypothetical protein SAMN04488034_101239 [Salinimicrobium catena]